MNPQEILDCQRCDLCMIHTKELEDWCDINRVLSEEKNEKN